MVDIAQIDEKTFVSGQIEPEDMSELARRGIRLVVNNRPDGEAPEGQPFALEIEAAAKQNDLRFVNLPFTAQTLTLDEVVCFVEILKNEEGPILAYCRTGNRSSILWAAAQIALGASIDSVLEGAERAGYNLSAAAPAIDALGQAARGR